MNELLLEKYAYKKKRSVLSPFIDDIKTLLEHDATQKSVIEYLNNEQGITVTQAYLSQFIKKHIKGKLDEKKKLIVPVKETGTTPTNTPEKANTLAAAKPPTEDESELDINDPNIANLIKLAQKLKPENLK